VTVPVAPIRFTGLPRAVSAGEGDVAAAAECSVRPRRMDRWAGDSDPRSSSRALRADRVGVV